MPKQKRYAIITPYYKEQPAVLARCLASVRAQTEGADHFMIADGFPQDWLDGEPVRHVRLDAAHGDFGNVARGMGAMLAVAESYGGIGFLDADNWFEADHVERCVSAGHANTVTDAAADLVLAKRRYVRHDGSPIPVGDDTDHVDTNCFWFRPGAFHLLPYWAMMPKELTCFGDRIFYRLVRERNIKTIVLHQVTVNYLCLWESVYRAAGETPPADAKPNLQMDLAGWYRSLTEAERDNVVKRCGVDVFSSLAPRRS